MESRTREIHEKEELLRFQWEEIERSQLVEGEEEELLRDRLVLENSETLLSALREITERLSGGENSVGEHLGMILKHSEPLKGIDPRLEESFETMKTLTYQVDDLWRTLIEYEKRIEFDPVRLETIEERLDLLHSLKKKYGGTMGEILLTQKRIGGELKHLEKSGEETASLRERLKSLERELTTEILTLSEKRVKGAKDLETQIIRELRDLGMEGSRFHIELQKIEDPEGLVELNGKRYHVREEGIDLVEFLLSTNPGEELKPLRKIASGGEISRIMLALKGILKDPIPTLIFDEVDVGIGGKMADVIGRRLKDLSKTKQVICITHLPQIAVQGKIHFQVLKKRRDGRTITEIVPLEGEERKREIARMLGGTRGIAIQHAEEMLKDARKP